MARKKSVNILLIEDDEDDAFIIKDFLDEAKDIYFETTHVTSLSRALEQLKKADFNAILADLNLPDSQGLETVRVLKRHLTDTPIIVISGLDDQFMAMNAVKIGAHDYLVKGIITPSALRRVLLYTLNRQVLTESLTENLEKFRAIIENEQNGLLIVDNTGIIQFCNKTAARFFGKEPEDLIKQEFGIPVVPDETSQVNIGSLILELKSQPIVWQKRQAFLINLYDITEHLAIEERIKAQNRAYRTLLRANEALIRIEDEQKLLDDICYIVVQEGGYYLAWIGVAEHDRFKSVRPVAFAGPAQDYLKEIKISWAKNKYGMGPTGKAIRSGQPVVVQNFKNDSSVAPWHHAAQKFNILSSIALPLKVENKVIGALNIYSQYQQNLDQRELELLQELAANLSFGLQNLKLKKEKERTEQNLALSHEKYKTLFNRVPVGLYISSPDKNIFEVNQYLLKMTGFKSAEELKKFMNKHRSLSLDAETFQKTLNEKGSVYNHETQWRTKEGKLIWVKENAVAVKDENGKILYYEGMAENITPRKEAELALQEQQKMYSTIVNMAQEGIWLLDAKAKTTFVNPKMAAMLGYDVKEMLGKSYFDFVHKKNLKQAKEYWHKQLQSQNVQHKLCFKRKDGRELWGLVSSASLLDTEFKSVLKMVVDITEIRIIHQQLEQTNRQLMEILESSSAVLYSLAWQNNRPVFVHITPNVERLFGYQPEELLNNPDFWQEKVHPDDLPELLGKMPLLQIPGKYNFEYRIRHKDGHYLWVFNEIRVTPGTENPKTKITCVWIDITERRKLEMQFLRSQRMESLGALAGGIAHDLNNILTPILLATEVLRFKAKGAGIERVVSMVEESTHRGKELVQQILSFARGAEGEHKAVQVKHLIGEITKVVKQTFPKNIQFSASVPKDLWPVLADATQLNQVLMNLCVNARDAMPEGGQLKIIAENIEFDKHYTMMHGEAKPGPYIKISVIDSGTGIPRHIIDKIFDPFFTTKEKGKGTGLGLSTVHTIVKNHGGFMNVYSEPNKGTTFNVYLPAQKSAVLTEQKEETQDLTGQGQTILVVDDEQAIREIISNTLIENGYQVITAADGAEAVSLFAQNKEKIDLMLTDISMPFMDGPATIRAVRKIKPEIKIIAMSGRADKVEVEHGENIKLLIKPFTAVTLLKNSKEMFQKK